MFEVMIEGRFSAAHQLRLPDGGLEPLHGHDWNVRVVYQGPALDAMGVLVDFTVVKPRLDAVLATLHHANLNELAAFAERNPSAEWVAVHIAEQLAGSAVAPVELALVEVEEEPGCWGRYRPQG
jgi:6-pyruvoyltetrahydropterin/6-carboxytetrahydropterin synthase